MIPYADNSKSMNFDEDTLTATGCISQTIVLCQLPFKKGKIWVREWLRPRETLEAYTTIVLELQFQDCYHNSFWFV